MLGWSEGQKICFAVLECCRFNSQLWRIVI